MLNTSSNAIQKEELLPLASDIACSKQAGKEVGISQMLYNRNAKMCDYELFKLAIE